MFKIWVTGSKGQLGRTLADLQGKLPDAEFIFTDIEELDLTREADVIAFAAAEEPDWIINCAAYTEVDKAESEPDKAFLLNRDIPAFLAGAADRCRSRLIYLSTDFVFDGSSDRPYREEDIPQPLSVYAKSKYAGEQVVLAGGRHMVVRTSWLYSPYGRNFVKTMLRLGREREEIGVVTDQRGSPTLATDLASALLKMISGISRPNMKIRPIYHYSNEGNCSWFEFASEIMRLAGLPCRINPIPGTAYPTPAKRPAYSVMNLDRIRQDFGINIPGWKESLKISLPHILGSE